MRQKPSLFAKLATQLGSDLIASALAEDDEKRQYWREHPLEWMVDNLGVDRRTIIWSENPEYDGHVWDGTPDPLYEILQGLVTHRRVGAESGVATGKTFLLHAIIYWFLSCWKGTVITIAPKEKQLKLHVWKEVRKNWARFHRVNPRAELTDLRLRMEPFNDDWAAHGFSVGVSADEESATKAQGFHQEHMLVIIEEGPGVPGATLTAMLNTSVDEHNLVLMVGNPDHQLDTLHSFCTMAHTKHVQVSALDHPNVVTGRRVVPGAVTPISIQEKLDRYGEAGPLYQSRVRGISPAEATDALIKLSWCYASRDRGRAMLEKVFPNDEGATLDRLLALDDVQLQSILPEDYARALGVDVANSKEGDRGAIGRGLGPILCEVDSFPCPDANELGRRVGVEIVSFNIDPDWVGVDYVGVGAGTGNQLKGDGHTVQFLNGGHAPVRFTTPMADEMQFANLRSQQHWLMREDLQHARIILPDDPELFQDLITPRFETRNGKIYVESKEQLKKRLGRSPDKGDAAIYWNWVRQVRAGASGSAAVVDL